ncbi:META domain-containing protein [Cellulomonas fengjieae]|uniref:META domain-containing protein n=1 Tax=Cellulomonas fengjieae TaxID=2819978 RepID=A0ABS3SDG9_9CELL|nr:META domain-containing protein [Cellulomonas fengjieae]MBO3083802.1 META domain-containing protein [Cellulomonas fengjieae]MBO3101449.1 META domain-containing protein [Cellulomonas fengjieae]QVI64909.1 META domain-containing protein [Cellulomonas fengjieae]
MVDLAGTWRFTALEGAELEGAYRGTPWLTFDGDGQVFGLAGVNRIRGTWRLAGGTLTFGPMVSTLMAGPPDAMTREQQVLRLVGEPVTVSTPDEDTLELTGVLRARLVRDPGAGDASD